MANPLEPKEAAIVTMRSFTVGGADFEQFVVDLTSMVESLHDEIEGLRQVTLLREYGTGRVAVLAEWESHAAQVNGTALLYQHEALGQVTRRGGAGESHSYEIVVRHSQTLP